VSIEKSIKVLDRGYVRHIKHMGDDLDPVNSAKASFAKESFSFEEKEARLLAFLVREEHTAVFRHSAITLEVYAPLMVARQVWKYVVASTHLDDQNGWSESSRRYITENVEFYLPGSDEWRSAPENRKQGSGEAVPFDTGRTLTEMLLTHQAQAEEKYNLALKWGIAPEQARLFLPAYGLYVRWRWTFSLGAGLHFLHQRLADDSQYEIREYARAVKDILSEYFPNVVKSMEEL
jgi:thymidylate synthase (FAD)